MKKEEDKLTRELFKNMGTESPSEEFEKVLMEKIYTLEKPRNIVYEPLIPKKILIWISFFTLLSIITMVFFMDKTSVFNFPFEFNLSLDLPKIDIPKISFSFPDFNIPVIWLYISLTIPLFFIFEKLGQKWLQIKED